jgi:hypothetical protein
MFSTNDHELRLLRHFVSRNDFKTPIIPIKVIDNLYKILHQKLA